MTLSIHITGTSQGDITGVRQADRRLTRLTLIARSRQTASFDEWTEALQEAHAQQLLAASSLAYYSLAALFK